MQENKGFLYGPATKRELKNRTARAVAVLPLPRAAGGRVELLVEVRGQVLAGTWGWRLGPG